jgi:uncharacterized protein YjbI with pentapeptide repeats
MSRAAFAPFTSFDGRTFDIADFRDAEFVDKVTFRNTRFNGTADFRGAKFNGVADFSGAEFNGELDFTGATFKEPLRFDKIKFWGKANFAAVQFHHDAHFSETEFAGDADFSKAIFHAWGLFNRSHFKTRMTFEAAEFRGSANFTDVFFATDADFRTARFTTYGDFPRATFQGKALFSGAQFECKTIFREAQFLKEADFSDCRFTHPVTFSSATFSDMANFDRVVLLQFVDFSSAKFHGPFVLSPPNGSQALAPEIRFESVILKDPDKIRFSNISFEKITLMGTNLRGIHFENPKWPRKGWLKSTRRAVVYDEIQKEKPDPQKLAQLYRDIRSNLSNAGTTADLGDLFYSEMEVRRTQPRGDRDSLYAFRRYLSPYTLLWLTCGYGRRPLRLVVVAVIAVISYWMIAGR